MAEPKDISREWSCRKTPVNDNIAVVYQPDPLPLSKRKGILLERLYLSLFNIDKKVRYVSYLTVRHKVMG